MMKDFLNLSIIYVIVGKYGNYPIRSRQLQKMLEYLIRSVALILI